MDTNTEGFINLRNLGDFRLSEEKEQRMLFNILDLKGNYRRSRAYEILNLLDKNEVSNILELLNNFDWKAVGLDGIASNYNEGDQVGSYRLSVLDSSIAEALYLRLSKFINTRFKVTSEILTDATDGSEWEFVGVNPLLRLIRYNEGGLLVPHYDGSYKPSEDYRSLKTLVIYLEGEEGKGSTRFIKDNQIKEVNKDKLDRSDWDRLATKDEVLYESEVIGGKGLVFDHFILHDSEPLDSSSKVKTIIRTDLMYKRINK